MKKILLKILETLLTSVVLVVTQYHIRRYYNIDPRIVVCGIYFVGFLCFFCIFRSEIKSIEECFKTQSFFDFVLKISEKTKQKTKKIKAITIKIVTSNIYESIYCVTMMLIFTGIFYKSFFRDDFMERKSLNIIFLSMIAVVTISIFISTIVMEKEKRSKKEFVLAGLYLAVFAINCLDFYMY